MRRLFRTATHLGARRNLHPHMARFLKGSGWEVGELKTRAWFSLSHAVLDGSNSSEKQTNHSVQEGNKSPETPLLKQLQARIKFTGPLTVYDYMKEVLINPVCGYYAAGGDMFGSSGDYITSPEICQMFGEMVGVWVFNEWHKLGSPEPFQLVELGPGRGTLMQDILRVLRKLGVSDSSVSVRLVEVSKELSEQQERKLCNNNQSISDAGDDVDYYKHNITPSGTDVFWYRHLDTVPRVFSICIAHEFFDVLPIHKMRNTESGWREVLIDIDEGDGPHHLRYVLSRDATPATKLYVQPDETRNELEVCPEAAVFCKEFAKRIEEDGGIALIMDYGYDGNLSSTFRAFKNHALYDPLCEPGTADLTADVDFSYLKTQVMDRLTTFGPVTQSSFLKNMGIEYRLNKLLQHCKPEEHKVLISGYRMLTDRDQMGERFKVLAFFPGVVKDFLIKYPPVGFYRDFEGS